MNWTSLISAWWLLPVAVVCFLGARFLYQKKGWLVDLDKKYRAILIALRTFVLLSLVLLLFGIVFEYKKYRDEKPMLIHVIDNSKSAKNYKDSAQVESNVAKLSSAIANELSEKYSIVTMPLHETGKKIQFSGETTNLSSHIESLRNLYVNKNIGAFLLTTDGNYNEGSSPLYTAEGFNFVPFYTLGIGDTIYKRDQLIRDVISNEYAYLNNSFPVEVEIEGRKVKGLNTFVELYEGNRLIEKKSIRFEEDFSFKQVSFQLNAAKIGVQRYTVKLPNADRE